MRSLFAYSLLAVQLVLVHFVAAQEQTYAVGSVKTKYWIANYSVTDGGEVKTSRGSSDTKEPPPNALFLSINPGPGSDTNATIYDDSTGLYVGLDEPITPDSTLKWVSTEYHWQIAYFGTDNSSFVIHPPGQDYYWFDNLSIPNAIQVERGRNIIGSDFLWTLQPTS